MLESGDDGRFLLSSRCKILTAVSIIVVFAEIVSLYHWETTYYVPETEFRKSSWHEMSVIGWGVGVETNTSLMSYSEEPATSVLQSQVGSNQNTWLAPNASIITRLPGGGVRLSVEVQEELNRRLKAATEKKVILVWVPMFSFKGPVNINATQCGKCEVTYDHNRINDGDVGAVLFHFHAVNAKNMPPKRNPDQLYIFWAIESTATLRVVRGHSLKFEDSFKFNATMSYRRESEFYQSYEHVGAVESFVENNNLSLEELLKLKDKMAIAIVSNCAYTPGARIRMRMLKELDNLKFGFEGYGGCFKGKFPPNRASSDFHESVRRYKFYFSFENSKHCKDYITEKFFSNALASLTVPVVWGGKKEDYEAVAPPGSFIFAEDFSSMKALSEYLKYLDKNDTAYLEYLRWLTLKPSEMPQYGRARAWCHVCRALHGINVDDVYSPNFDEDNLKRPLFTKGIAKRSVDHLIDWLYGEDNPECFQR